MLRLCGGCFKSTRATLRAATTGSAFAARRKGIASAAWRRQSLFIQQKFDSSPPTASVIDVTVRHVWNESYEQEKEANDIVQAIQQCKARWTHLMSVPSQEKEKLHDNDCGSDFDVEQRLIFKLKQDYLLVTGEEYDDGNHFDTADTAASTSEKPRRV
jgi:hypothetical protein